MKIQICSDLHIEHGSIIERNIKPSADILVIAGDINSGFLDQTLNKLSTMFKHVIAVMGNHDYYGHDINTRVDKVKETLNGNVHLLDGDVYELQGYRFIGCNLWSDFIKGDYFFKSVARKSINDYNYIKKGGRSFTPDDAYDEYVLDQEFIRYSLFMSDDVSKNIVVTHSLPSSICTHPNFKDHRLNPYFIGNCDKILNDFEIPLWIFGHSHGSIDIKINDKTRLVSNCIGYPSERLPDYKADFVIKI